MQCTCFAHKLALIASRAGVQQLHAQPACLLTRQVVPGEGVRLHDELLPVVQLAAGVAPRPRAQQPGGAAGALGSNCRV